MEKPEQRAVTMPVDRLSYSGLTQLLRNPIIFKLKMILGVYDSKSGVSGMVGKAGHQALRYYYGGDPDRPVSTNRNEAMNEAITVGLDYLNSYDDSWIKYGKTGSREKMLKAYTKAMSFYFAEEPEYHEVISSEEKISAEMKTADGEKLPLPGVCVPDLVVKTKKGKIEVIDTKFVKNFTRYEDEDGQPYEDYIKIIQSQFIWHILRGAKQITADEMIFREIKYTENQPDKDTGQVAPQVRDWVIPFDHKPYQVIFYNIYKDVVNFLSNPNAIYLPNLSDPMDGEQAGILYAQGLLNSDMSDVEVMHKVKDVAYVSKKFISSRLDQVENKHLNPEDKIKLRLEEFGIPVVPVETKVGASATQYRFKVSRGIRMNTIHKHKADIALAIEAKGDIRILAPIPGTALIGIEVQNEARNAVKLAKEHFTPDTLTLPIGVDISGQLIKMPLDEMPHLLIAGSTGSGKSILLHAILTAITKQKKPADLRLVLIDPKRVELIAFAKAKHLHGGKVIYKYEEALAALAGLAEEMETRYTLLEQAKKRDLKSYNTSTATKLPYIVVVIDEYADLTLKAKHEERKKKSGRSIQNAAYRAAAEVIARQFARQGISYTPKDAVDEQMSAEDLIIRLAQMARAVGIHLIISTQRPSIDVISGLIKANFPTRIALTTSSATDSKIIIGEEGAEKLGGKGDMLLHAPGRPLTRLQGLLSE